MAKLTDEMKDLVGKQQAFVATASRSGIPNVGPKRSTRVLDDENLVFTEMTGGRTYENLRQNPQLCIAVVDRDQLSGYRFYGKAEVLTSGALFDAATEVAKQRKLPPPKAVVKMKIDEIYNLGMKGGPGKKIA